MSNTFTNNKNIIEQIKLLKKKAVNAFTFKGRRKVHNSTGVFIDVPANITAPGRKSRPYDAYIKLASNKPFVSNEPPIPNASTKLIIDKTLKSMKMRNELFMPLELKGVEPWLEKQKKYIDNLSVRDFEIIQSYTSHGDKIINNYCRGNLGNIKDLLEASMYSDHSLPFAYSLYDQYATYIKKIKMPPREVFVDDAGNLEMSVVRGIILSNIDFFQEPRNMKSLLDQYRDDIACIIDKSPRLTQPLIVYRGIQDETYLKSNEFKNKDFLSTTIDPFHVLPFTKKYIENDLPHTYHCCVYELTVDKNVPCLYMQFVSKYANEFEVLIHPEMNIKLSDKVYIRNKPAVRTVNKAGLLKGYKKEQVLVVSGTVSIPKKKTKMKTKMKTLRTTRTTSPNSKNSFIMKKTRKRTNKHRGKTGKSGKSGKLHVYKDRTKKNKGWTRTRKRHSRTPRGISNKNSPVSSINSNNIFITSD